MFPDNNKVPEKRFTDNKIFKGFVLKGRLISP